MAFGTERFDAKYRSRTPPAAHRKQFTQPKFIHDGRLFLYEGSIFDKLQDPQLFTGSHKCRFDPSTGRGRGLRGRDSSTVTDSVTYFADHGIRGDDMDGRRWVSSLRAATHYPTALGSLTTLGHVAQNATTASSGRLRELQPSSSSPATYSQQGSARSPDRQRAAPVVVSVELDPATGTVRPLEPHSDASQQQQARERYQVAPPPIPYPQEHVPGPTRDRPAMSFSELMQEGRGNDWNSPRDFTQNMRMSENQDELKMSRQGGTYHDGGDAAEANGVWIAPPTDRGPKRTHALIRDRETKSQISGLFRQMLEENNDNPKTSSSALLHQRQQQQHQQIHTYQTHSQPLPRPNYYASNPTDLFLEAEVPQQPSTQWSSGAAAATAPISPAVFVPMMQSSRQNDVQHQREFERGGGAPTLDEMLAVMPQFRNRTDAGRR